MFAEVDDIHHMEIRTHIEIGKQIGYIEKSVFSSFIAHKRPKSRHKGREENIVKIEKSD